MHKCQNTFLRSLVSRYFLNTLTSSSHFKWQQHVYSSERRLCKVVILTNFISIHACYIVFVAHSKKPWIVKGSLSLDIVPKLHKCVCTPRSLLFNDCLCVSLRNVTEKTILFKGVPYMLCISLLKFQLCSTYHYKERDNLFNPVTIAIFLY